MKKLYDNTKQGKNYEKNETLWTFCLVLGFAIIIALLLEKAYIFWRFFYVLSAFIFSSGTWHFYFL